MSYFLPENYAERLGAPQSYDIGGNDKWQDEVYKLAAELANVLDSGTIIDVGTGSGFKLMKYFLARYTVGLDLEPAVARLRQQYPSKLWYGFGEFNIVDANLVICSDVIEHVDDPDKFLEGLKIASHALFVISTPDRKLMERYPSWGKKFGPPGNGCHVREWAFYEFREYISTHFDILRHFTSNKEQCTQCVIAKVKST